MISEPMAFIGGGGLLGTAVIRGLLQAEAVRPDRISITARSSRTLGQAAKLGVHTGMDNMAAVRGADVVFLCVPPRDVCSLLDQIRSELSSRHLLVSFAAGITTPELERMIGMELPVVWVMPNTAVRVCASMTMVVPGRFVRPEQVDFIVALMQHLGVVEVIEERLMNAATAVAGCGPAFAFRVIEALAQGGIKIGLPRDKSMTLAAQALLGAARMVHETGLHPAVLRDDVSTPGGCTIDGLAKLESCGLGTALIEAVAEAAEKASCLHKK